MKTGWKVRTALAVLFAVVAQGPGWAKSSQPQVLKRYRTRYDRAVRQKNVKDLVKLAKWCRTKRLFDEEETVLRQASQLDPAHKGVKRLLQKLEAKARRHANRKTPWRLDGKVIFIETNTTEAKLHRYAAAVNAFYKRFSKIFKIKKTPLQIWGKKIGVRIFRSREDFAAYRRDSGDSGSSESTVGYYHLGRKELILYDDPDDPAETLDTLFHEGTHLFAHMALGNQSDNLPPWINEGIAEYFGPSRFDPIKQDLSYGLPQYNRLIDAKRLIKRGGVSLKSLLTRKYSAFSVEDYALSWSLVHMLIEKKKKKRGYAYRSAFLTCFDKVRHGADSATTLQQAARTPLDTLEAEWHQYVRSFPLPSFHEGLAYLRQKKPKLAQPLLAKHCQAHPQDAQGHYYLGDSHFDLDQLEEAVACYRKAVAANPTYANALGSLAFCLAMMEKGEEAVPFGRRAVQVAPSAGNYYYYAYACAKAKAKAEGLKAITKAIELRGETTPDLAQLKTTLQKL